MSVPEGCLVKFATTQRFKWGEVLERSKVRSLCVHPAWHLWGSTTVFLSPGNAWFGHEAKKEDTEDSIHSFASPGPLFSLPTTSPPPPASFLPTGWLYSLAPLDSSPSGRRHLNWTAAIAVAPSVAPFSLPTKIWTRVRKSLILFKSTLLLRSCIFQRLLSSETIVVCRNRNLQMSLTLWTRFIARFM